VRYKQGKTLAKIEVRNEKKVKKQAGRAIVQHYLATRFSKF